MRNFTEDFMLHNLSKKVIDFIRELEQPHRDSNKLDFCGHLERLYKTGEFSKQDYLFAKARVLLNRFCYDVEEHIGGGVQTGFLFYCQDRDLLCYGAGANYPENLKKSVCRLKPGLDMKGDTDYKDDIFTVEDIDTWDNCIHAEDIRATGFKSMTSKRMRLNGFTFGIFGLFFPEKGGATEEEIQYVREKLQPVKEKLYHIREEMLEAVEHTIDRMGPENYSNNKATFLSLALGFSLFEDFHLMLIENIEKLPPIF